MKFFTALTFTTAAFAAPATLEPRQGGGGYCFVFARGSTEPSPLVSTVPITREN
jgi:hypothetical protein